MKKVLEKPVKMSKERQIQDPQLEQVTAQKSTNAVVEEFSLKNEKKGEVTGLSEEQKKYFRMSLFSIDPEQKEEFIKQSDMLKKKVQEAQKAADAATAALKKATDAQASGQRAQQLAETGGRTYEQALMHLLQLMKTAHEERDQRHD